MSGNRIPLAIKVQPWFQDHSVGGRIVLPAVETMLLLASECLQAYPLIDVRVMEDVRFGKFLEIPNDAMELQTWFEHTTAPQGHTRAKLLSQTQLGTMTRIKEHGEILFSLNKVSNQPSSVNDPSPHAGPVMKISAEDLYRNLVPFGPHYHSLQDTFYFSGCQAWGELKAPELPFTHAVQTQLGSPFPLDGAMHAACVLGQQFVNFPPFPVGFAKRVIVRPTQPGARYATRVVMTARTPDELIFDAQIFNSKGQLYETVTGIRMRDVSRAIKKQILQ
jgi:hypothetical protein